LSKKFPSGYTFESNQSDSIRLLLHISNVIDTIQKIAAGTHNTLHRGNKLEISRRSRFNSNYGLCSTLWGLNVFLMPNNSGLGTSHPHQISNILQRCPSDEK
jgi:hypothetical protein